MNIIPCDRIVSATGDGSTNSEDKSLIKGTPQQFQDPPALRGVREIGFTRYTLIWKTRVRMLLLRRDIRGFSA